MDARIIFLIVGILLFGGFFAVGGKPDTALQAVWNAIADLQAQINSLSASVTQLDQNLATTNAGLAALNNVVSKTQLSIIKNGDGSGTVSSSPSGINCGASCSAMYDANQIVMLTATPDDESEFAGWGGACSGAEACSFPMNETKTVYAKFNKKPITLTVTRTGSGTVSGTPMEIYCGAACTANYDSGTTVTLAATPDESESFIGWGGDCTGTGACLITMNSSKNVSAAFTTNNSFSLAINKGGNGGGLISSNPSRIDCGQECTASFTNGSWVTLTAVADANSNFLGWSGCSSFSGATCTVQMSSAKNIMPVFAKRAVRLAIAKTGLGIITSDVGGILCGSTCAATFDAGTNVRLVATPDSTSSFVGWSGACTGTETCALTLNADTDVNATFRINRFDLAVNKTGTGNGTISSSPAGIDCGPTCAATYDSGQLVTLTAIPDATSTFTGWSGACTGTGNCIVTMNASKSVTAIFTRNQVTLTVTKSGVGSGLVVSSPAGIDCGANCVATYGQGTAVTLVAIPAPDSVFATWGGDCGGTEPCSLTLNSSRTVSATFFPTYPY